MPQCAIATCNNTHRRTKGGNVRYHRFPGDSKIRIRWLKLCGKTVPNCSTARVCSLHFSSDCYERDVQHELLGLPSRCRLRKGAVPDMNLPSDMTEEDKRQKSGSAIEILLAVGLIPSRKTSGGMPLDLNKMRIMEDVKEGCIIQPSSPGHAELRPENEPSNEEPLQTSSQTDDISVKDEFEVPSEDCQNNINTDQHTIISKRKASEDETPAKKLRTDIDENFRQRNKLLNDFMQVMDCDNSNIDQLQTHTEQLLAEIKTLNDLAREKETEWNNIIHLKKIKEELLIRIERKRQIGVMNGTHDNDTDYETKNPNQSLLKHNLTASSRLNRNRHILAKQHHFEINGQGVRNRPTLDVQSIIADHRQRHPEAVPRRGKRIRNSPNCTNGNSGILNLSSMALGSGAQVRHNIQDVGGDLNLLLAAIDNNSTDYSRTAGSDFRQSRASFKDMLVEFAKLSQNEKMELLQDTLKPPPPYPEVTVHPLSSSTTASSASNSLLHGILTKSPAKGNQRTGFSPTLAKLLTAPERSSSSQHASTSNLIHPSSMSITEILSTNKARNEITITPVEGQFEQPTKKGLNADDDETEDSADRLVIDESNEDVRRGVADNNSDPGDEVPQCQGCNQKTAQFVCAGCGNQWYCSRDCQVAAWDEHSEACSG